MFGCSLSPHWVKLQPAVGLEKSVSHWFPPGPSATEAERQWKLKQESATPHNSMTVKRNTISSKQSDSQITCLGGVLFADQQNCPHSVPLCHCVSLCLPLSLPAPQTLSVCSNEWQSGDVVLIYCMVAQMEPGWNVSVIGASLRKKHLWCLGTPNCSIRNGFPL